MPTRALREGERGTTIIELLVVIAIMGVLIGIAAPTVSTQVANAELNRGARDVVSLLRRVRAEAINEQVPRYVDLTLADRLQVFRCTPNSDFTNCTWAAQGSVVPLPGSARVTVSSGDFPALANTPVAGQAVPAGSVYFGTRGGYPFASGASTTVYTLTITSIRIGSTRTVTVARNTGHVNLENF